MSFQSATRPEVRERDGSRTGQQAGCGPDNKFWWEWARSGAPGPHVAWYFFLANSRLGYASEPRSRQARSTPHRIALRAGTPEHTRGEGYVQ